MRAYAIYRPLGPFTWPSEYRDVITDLHNYDHRQFVEEIGREAFGYIEFEEGSVPKDALERYELWTDPAEDRNLVMVGRELAKCVKKEDWERFESSWDIAQRKYGYNDDEIERAMSWYEEGGRFEHELDG